MVCITETGRTLDIHLDPSYAEQTDRKGPADGFATLNVFRADDYAPHISLLAVAYVIFIVYHHSTFKSHVLL
ncbi:hypothetical protein Tco_1423699 [Tanacetum coccineum]